MKKNGFTLTELLAVIVIIALLAVAAVPAVISIGNNNKKNMFCKKIQTIQRSAQIYGEDYFEDINNTNNGSISEMLDDNKPCTLKLGASASKLKTKCQITTIDNLAGKGYVNYEKIGKQGAPTEVLDPRTSTSIKNTMVMIFIVNKRIHAQYVYKTRSDADKCTTSIKVGNKNVKELYYVDENSTADIPIVRKENI